MKNQYFGDERDYKKYGILRILQKTFPEDKIAICWMLTPDDGSSDGRKIGYLNNKKKERNCDPELFEFLYKAIILNKFRNVEIVKELFQEDSVVFFNDKFSDDMKIREQYFIDLKQATIGCKLIFFDPDTGIATAKMEKDKKKSTKHIFLNEIRNFCNVDKSVLIYQHFPHHIKRTTFVNNTVETLFKNTNASEIIAFNTSNVVFFLLVGLNHSKVVFKSCNQIRDKWNRFISIDHFNFLHSF